MRARILGVFAVLAALALLLIWRSEFRSRSVRRSSPAPAPDALGAAVSTSASKPERVSPSVLTAIYAHNLLLRQAPGLQIYVNWLSGHLTPTHAKVAPSFDEPESFLLDVETGVLHVDLAEVANYLNSIGMSKSSLHNIHLSGNDHQLKLSGVLHKMLPIEMTSVIFALPDGRIRLHVTKIGVVKIPVNAILNDFHLKIVDLFDPKSVPGVEVSDNDIYLDPVVLMPPPHIRGRLTEARVVNSNLEEVYGSSTDEEARVEQWRNFLRLRDGTISFGRITMHPVDIIMIDTSNDRWFDLDLVHYQDQIVNGYTRMTPQAGLQIFMPDLSLIQKTKANADIGIEWMKNRNKPPPAAVASKE